MRWLMRLSVWEWIALITLGGWLWQRISQHSTYQSSQRQRWLIDICVVITVLALVGSAIWQIRWLGLVAFGAAALGLAIGIRNWLSIIRGWFGGLFSRK
ncbi:hypothetical protein ACP8Y2_11945 [Herpetosiphon llansteffanensis]